MVVPRPKGAGTPSHSYKKTRVWKIRVKTTEQPDKHGIYHPPRWTFKLYPACSPSCRARSGPSPQPSLHKNIIWAIRLKLNYNHISSATTSRAWFYPKIAIIFAKVLLLKEFFKFWVIILFEKNRVNDRKFSKKFVVYDHSFFWIFSIIHTLFSE